MQVEVGNILEAKVTGITKFGAFVKFENDQTAMVHISEIAPTYVNDISEHLSMGQGVKVKILNISEDGKISASIKRTLPVPERPAGGPPRGGAPRGGSPRPAGGGGAPRSGGQRPAPNANRGRGGQQNRSNLASQFPPQPASFEDMLSKFMQQSDDKMSDMKKTMNVKHQNSRRGRK